MKRFIIVSSIILTVVILVIISFSLLPCGEKGNFTKSLQETPAEPIETKMFGKIPFTLSVGMKVNGITPGNLVNGGDVTTDGENVYYNYTEYGDMGHPFLVRRNIATNEIQFISGYITKQMSKMINQKVGGGIQEDVSFLNIHNDKLYYYCNGNNLSTNAMLGEGEFYPGDDITGLMCMNLDGSDRKCLKTQFCGYINVVNDKIYYKDQDALVCQMNIDGNDDRVVLDEPCQFLKVSNNTIYYTTRNSNTLILRSLDKDDSKTLIEKGCFSPIIFEEKVIYLNQDHQICSLNLETLQITVFGNVHAEHINSDNNFIYYTDLDNNNALCKMSIDGSNNQTIYDKGKVGSINVVGDYIFFYSSNPYFMLCRINNLGQEYEKLEG